MAVGFSDFNRLVSFGKEVHSLHALVGNAEPADVGVGVFGKNPWFKIVGQWNLTNEINALYGSNHLVG